MIKCLGDKTKNIGIKKIMKKNQVVILALALMLMTAGYLNYTNNHENENSLLAGLGDAQLVSANAIDGNDVNQSENTGSDLNDQNILNESIKTNQETSTQTSNDDYFTRSKLERETMYSQMLETYTGILENEKISSEQKDIAENEIKNINDTKNAIMVVENLFKTKGFENAIVLVNSPSVNVVIKAKELSTEQVAQIQNIVQRELKTEIENIHITTN